MSLNPHLRYHRNGRLDSQWRRGCLQRLQKSESLARLINHVSPIEMTNILRVRRGQEGTRCIETEQQEP